MEKIDKYLNSLNSSIEKQAKKKSNEDQAVKEILGWIFAPRELKDIISSFYSNGEKLILISASKVAASELFIKKEQIQAELTKRKQGKQVVIR